MILAPITDPIEVFFFAGMIATAAFWIILKLLEKLADKNIGD
jgi:hypothetical protein